MDWDQYSIINLNGQGFGPYDSFDFSIVPAKQPMDASFEIYSELRNVKVLDGHFSVSKAGAVSLKLEGFDRKLKCSRDGNLKHMWHYLTDVSKDASNKDVSRIFVTCQ